MAYGSAPAAYAEGEPPVGGGVGDGGDEERGPVGDLRPDAEPEEGVQGEVEEGGEDPDDAEPDQLAGQSARHPGQRPVARVVPEGPGQPVQRQRADGQRAPHPPHAFQVLGGRPHDVDGRVGVVDPVDGHLVDAQPGPFGQDQQLGVEEPAAVLHHRQQPLGHLPPDRLEPALGVAEPGGEGGAQDEVVGARDELPLRPAYHPRTPGEPGADGQVGVAGDQRGDQREEGVEVGGEVDVHIGEDGCVGGRPDRTERPPAPLLLQPHRPHPAQLRRERGRHGGVESVDALSATVMRKAYGKVRERWSWRRRTQGRRSFSSL